MYILYSLYKDGETPIAEFDDETQAMKYVDGCTLEKYPTGTRRFRQDSLLGSCNWYDIRLYEKFELPKNPQVPTAPLQVEYILEVKGPRDYRSTKINYGINRDEANREKVFYEQNNYEVKLITREV